MENKIETKDANWVEVRLKKLAPRQMRNPSKTFGKNLQNENLMDQGKKDSKMESLVSFPAYIQL